MIWGMSGDFLKDNFSNNFLYVSGEGKVESSYGLFDGKLSYSSLAEFLGKILKAVGDCEKSSMGRYGCCTLWVNDGTLYFWIDSCDEKTGGKGSFSSGSGEVYRALVENLGETALVVLYDLDWDMLMSTISNEDIFGRRCIVDLLNRRVSARVVFSYLVLSNFLIF